MIKNRMTLLWQSQVNLRNRGWFSFLLKTEQSGNQFEPGTFFASAEIISSLGPLTLSRE